MACNITTLLPGENESAAYWGSPIFIKGAFADNPAIPLPPSQCEVELVRGNGTSSPMPTTLVTHDTIQASLPEEEDPKAPPYSIRVTTGTGSCTRTIRIAESPTIGDVPVRSVAIPAVAQPGEWVTLTLQPIPSGAGGGAPRGGAASEPFGGGVLVAGDHEDSVAREEGATTDLSRERMHRGDLGARVAKLDLAQPVSVFRVEPDGTRTALKAGEFVLEPFNEYAIRLLLPPAFTDYPAEAPSPFFSSGTQYEAIVSFVGIPQTMRFTLAQLPMALPRFAVLSRHTRFQTSDPENDDNFGTFLILVPGSAGFDEKDVEGFLKTLETVSRTLHDLGEGGLVGFAAWASGLDRLLNALKGGAASVAMRIDAVRNLHDVNFKEQGWPWGLFDSLAEDITAEDRTSAVAYMGAGGAVNLFNKRNLDPEWRWLQVGVRRPGIVLVDQLEPPVDVATDSGPQDPVTDPTNSWIVFDQYDPNREGFDDLFGSVELVTDVEALNPQ